MADRLTLLHLSDPQFGRNHLFGSSGLTVDDQHWDSLFTRLHLDLAGLASSHGLRPDVAVVSGDLAEWARPGEFEQVRSFLEALGEALELPRRRVLVVPGNHDISRAACQAYFLQCEANEERPKAPWWPKWELFAAMFTRFYEGEEAVSFDVDQPWTLFELPELRLVMAGLNSTMAESHRDSDHYGWVGEGQLRWFAERLRPYEDRGWLRVGVLHHNVVRGAVDDDENLRDAPDLERILAPRLNLLLHGHTHDAKRHRLGDLLVLSTGSAAVSAGARPAEVPNQYQLVRVHADRVERWGRAYALGEKRWIGDTRVSEDGNDWHDDRPEPFRAVHAAFPGVGAGAGGRPGPDPATPAPAREDDFTDRVAEVCALRNPGAAVRRRVAPTTPPTPYLRVVVREDGLTRQYAIGTCERGVSVEELDRFVEHVHRTFRTADPQVVSKLVYGGDPAGEELVRAAWRQGVDLVSFIQYQGILDLRGYVARQTARLERDPVYPPTLYVPQRFRLLDADDGPHDDLLEQVLEWVDAPQGRFVLVLGDFGRGKTFLLHQLARQIPARHPHLVPLLIQLRALEKARSLDELVAQHLAAAGEEQFDLRGFHYMLREGRVVLLFDGFDELAMRVASYDRATDHLETLLAAAEGRAKVVVSSRTQHFRSDEQVTTALGARVELLPGRRLVSIEDFGDGQIVQYLGNLYGGDSGRARERFDVLRDVRDLLGLSRNPRMLSFIAALPAEQLQQASERHGEITSAELYRLLLEQWLEHEQQRADPRGATAPLKIEERWEAVTRLALRLWQAAGQTVGLSELTGVVTATLDELADRQVDPAQAAHAVGSGTLLVRSEEGEFAFVHQSVMEWLVARHAADAVRGGDPRPEVVTTRRMSTLMADFLVGLLGREPARAWADALRTAPSIPDALKANALLVLDRLGEQLADSSLAGTDLRGASFSGENLRGADLHDADLSEARLLGADLGQADLRGADLSGTDLSGADLSGADLSGADLRGARLLRAKLGGARLDGSRWRRAALLGAEVERAALAELETFGAALPELVPRLQVAGSFAGATIAVTPDAELLAVAGDEGEIWVVDLDTRRPLRSFQSHQGKVHGLAFGPDGRRLASGGSHGTIRLWDPATGQPLHTLRGHKGGVPGVAFSPDGRRLASGGHDGTTRLWDPATGRHLQTLERHPDRVLELAFSPNGRYLAIGGRDGTIRLWDPSTGDRLQMLVGDGDGFWGVAWSPDGHSVVTGDGDGTVRFWDPATGQHLGSLPGREPGLVGAALVGVASGAGGGRLATGFLDGRIQLWDPATGQALHTLLDKSGSVTEVAFGAHGRYLVSGGDSIRLWDPATGQLLHTLRERPSIPGLAYSANGYLAGGGGDGTIRIWDPPTGQPLHIIDSRQGSVHAVAFSPDGRRLAGAGSDGAVRLWDLETGWSSAPLEGDHGDIWDLAFSPDGRQLACAGQDGTVPLRETATGTFIRELNAHQGSVRSVAFSPEGRRLASGGHDGTVGVWDLASGRLLHRLRDGQASVLAVAFSPDGRHLASSGSDGTIRLWDPATGVLVHTLYGHQGGALDLAFSPDGRHLASSGSDGTIRLWDRARDGWLLTLVPLADGWAAIADDGRYRLEGNADGAFWYAAGLCRFEPGELDPYVPSIRRVAAGEVLLPPGD